ncbi:MAG: S9 family peptidase [Bacteroidia bacterium]|nr:S9 family peptidase [Bacteroidia bacterium]
MKRIKFLYVVLFILSFSFLSAQNKIPLDHTVYDSWKDIENPIISDDGKWVSYEINPQKGDGWLFLRNCINNKIDSIRRGYAAKFSANSDFLIFKIKAQDDTIRKAKLAKKKDDDLPKDSLGILIFKKDSLKKTAKLKSFKLAKDNSTWIAYLLEKETAKKDSAAAKDKPVQDSTAKVKPKSKEKTKKKDKKTETGTLFLYNPLTSKTYQYKDVLDYSISDNGAFIGYITLKKDTTSDTTSVFIFDAAKEKSQMIFKRSGIAKKITFDTKGEQSVFIHSSDTAKAKSFNIFYWSGKSESAKCIVDTVNPGLQKGWCASENGEIYFSKDGAKLYFGTMPRPEKEKKDTLPDDEKVKVDIWNWKDTLIQPQQLSELEKEQKRNYLAVYHLKDNKLVQLASDEMQFVTPILKGNGNIGIGYSYKPYNKFLSWITNQYKDIYLVDFVTGNHKLILKKKQSIANISPNGNYIIWYEVDDSIYYVYSVKKEKSFPLTKDIKVNFWDEENDTPAKPDPYGLAGWSKDDKSALIYDRYDIWQVFPEGKEKFSCLTKGLGRKDSITFRYIELDRDAQWIDPEKALLLKGFSDKTKQESFYTTKLTAKENPKLLISGDYKFAMQQKAKNDDKLIWKKSNFNVYPNLLYSDFTFQNAIQLTDANPQQKKYLWGTVELVKWKSFDGKELEGLLYKPENFDAAKKYPMIVYFYERNSDQLNQYWSVRPSRSVIGFSEYVSNGYVIFVPDVKYGNGAPGQDAYNAIISGTEHILSKGFVNKDRMALQGQSWGGYQTAYLVTRTNIFKAAMAGAAVSNMTSAYGGIRWASGHSRMMQYEDGQSRIGGTLWEKRDLYIENSPVFFADKIETPLLLMNNDNDGAVPWYQGIEFFLALRRLNKPVWLLNYNGDDHNLKKRPNCVDLSIRMKQFFDYYLKDAPVPVWMDEGIPAVKKGKTSGYDLKK